MLGTWHFYVDDYRFQRLWDRPDLLPDTGALAAVETNGSIFDQTPLSVAITITYRKRWLARYWQSQGVRIWVDLNVAVPYAELNLNGVPAGWRAFATRGYEDHAEDVLREYKLAHDKAGCTPMLLVYGGGHRVREIAESIGAIHVTDDRTEVRRRLARSGLG